MRVYFTGNFLALLTAIFAGLKLADVIDWSWMWVLSPLWLPFAVALVVTFVAFLGTAMWVLAGTAFLWRAS